MQDAAQIDSYTITIMAEYMYFERKKNIAMSGDMRTILQVIKYTGVPHVIRPSN